MPKEIYSSRGFWRSTRNVSLLFAMILSTQVQAAAVIPVRIEFSFGGVPSRTVIPVADNGLTRMVTILDRPEGETRVEFVEGGDDGADSTSPFMSVSADAEIEMAPGGKVHFKFTKPVGYAYLLAYENSGRVERFKGEIKSIIANISPENSQGFSQILLGAPYTGYISKDKLNVTKEMARVYRSESAAEISNFPRSDLVPGLKLRGRAGLARYIDLSDSDLPSLLYPVNVPLEIKINPLENKAVLSMSRVNGGPDFRTIGAITKDMVGLDHNGTISAGGPNAFEPVVTGLDAVDLQDPAIHDFVAARAEVLRMQRNLESEYNRRHGIPSFSVSRNHIIMFREGRGDDENYDSFHRIETCVSLLTGKQSKDP